MFLKRWIGGRAFSRDAASASGLVFVPLTIPFMEAAFGEASEAQVCLASGTRAGQPGGLVFQRVLYSSLLKPLLIFTLYWSLHISCRKHVPIPDLLTELRREKAVRDACRVRQPRTRDTMNDAWRNYQKLPKELSSSTKSWECREHSEFCIEHLVLFWPRPWFATLDSDLCNFCCCIWWLVWIPSVTWAIKAILALSFWATSLKPVPPSPSLEFLSVKASPTSGQWDSRVRDLNSATHCQHPAMSEYVQRFAWGHQITSLSFSSKSWQASWRWLGAQKHTKTPTICDILCFENVWNLNLWKLRTREHQLTQVGYSELEYEAWKCTCQRRACRHADMPQIRRCTTCTTAINRLFGLFFLCELWNPNWHSPQPPIGKHWEENIIQIALNLWGWRTYLDVFRRALDDFSDRLNGILRSAGDCFILFSCRCLEDFFFNFIYF